MEVRVTFFKYPLLPGPALARISHRVTQRGGGDAGLTRLATKATAGVLDSTSRRPTEHNAVRTDVYATAVVSW